MSFKEPTYEEYRAATKWAKFKYKYSIVVLILCWILLIFLAYYMYSNGEAITTNPLIYGANKYGVECYCHNIGGGNPGELALYFNESSLLTMKR